MPTLTKADIRQSVLTQCRELDENQLTNHGLCVHKHLVSAQLALHTKTVAAYLAHDFELSLQPTLQYLNQHAVTVIVPKVEDRFMKFVLFTPKSTLVENRFGILEPDDGDLDLDEFAIALIPGMAFGLNGERLGRGGGYYDRYLQTQANWLKIGVGHDCQLVPEIPTGRYDVSMDAIVTESGWAYVSPNAEKHLNVGANHGR